MKSLLEGRNAVKQDVDGDDIVTVGTLLSKGGLRTDDVARVVCNNTEMTTPNHCLQTTNSFVPFIPLAIF